MMRGFLFALLLSAATMLAQTTPQTAPQTPPPAQVQSGAPAPTQRRQMMQQMQQMRQQHMQEMQQQLDKFAKLLEKLKTDSAKIQDATGKQLAQDNVDLWQALYEHMQGMAQMMQHEGMGMGMGMGRGPRRMGNPPPPTAQPKTTPPPQ